MVDIHHPSVDAVASAYTSSWEFSSEMSVRLGLFGGCEAGAVWRFVLQ